MTGTGQGLAAAACAGVASQTARPTARASSASALVAGSGTLPGRAVPLVLCGICDRPRADAPAPPDGAPCDATTARMESDLAEQRRPTTATPWTSVQW